uniref:Cadherin domain-containing protein n=1 Tax=Strigamia maritima TaxID=126957 RepID=T1J403_STRMM
MIAVAGVRWTLVVVLAICGRCQGLVDPFLEDASAVDIRVKLEVEEERPIGTVVGYIPTKVGFTYRFSDNSPEFNLNSTSGQISTAIILDRESMKWDRLDFVILSSQPTYPVEVRIRVLDVNDNAPTFPEPSIQVSFAESANAGTRVIIDAAHDRDIGKNSVTAYRIVSGNEEEKFKLIVVTNPSGETPYLNLETVGELDRETQSSYRLNISAQDGGSPPLMGFLIVEATIVDVNDNPPIFDHSDYVVSVNESVQPGSKVLRVHATDIDTEMNAKITYYLSDVEMQFVVDPDTGVIMTQDMLACPQNCPLGGKCTKSCVFTVFAHDHGSPRQDGRAYVTVNLLDSNDNDPHIAFRFNPPSAKFGTVDENAQNGTIVAAVSVVDPDDGPSGQTSVRIEAGNELRHFRIERNQDVDIIRVNSVLDREKISKYNLTIVASDKGSPPRTATSHLIIIVNDVNDHEPVFERSEYFAVLQELVPAGTFVVGILATDEDSGVNSNVFYAIASGNDNNWFHIDLVTGLVTTAKPLDREKQSVVTLKISARDGGPNPKWAFTMLRIEVLDENDETPTFLNPLMNLSLIENQPANTLLISLTANDGDQGTNGTVHYYLAEETNRLYPDVFTLDRKQGHLRTLTSLDREKIELYNIKVVATDLGQPPKSSTATVLLSVLDVNDNNPVFYPTNYFVTVEENATVGTVVVQLSASDADRGLNGELNYWLMSDLTEFGVSKNGLIELKSKLTKSQYELVVGVKDGGDRKAATDAVIRVMAAKNGVNAAKLEFTQSNGYFFTIQEDGPSTQTGSRQVGQISAFSQESKGMVEYSIILGDPFGTFSIGEHSGAIQTSRVVDREESAGYLLVVLAKLGNSYGKIAVNITINDINDNPPLFLNNSSQVYVKENSPKGYELFLAKAEDKDDGVNQQIRYNLTVNPGDVLGINANTGMLYLKKMLDYERVKEFDVEVLAQDGGTPVLMSRMFLKIVVVDVNDHTPVFEHLLYEASLSELTPVNSRFYVLTAKDDDSGANGHVMYHIQESVSAFGIFPDGRLYVKSSLDREKLDYYELTVVASDMGEKQRSCSVKVVIYILDENDNSPVFNNNTFNFTLSENEPADTYIGRLLASDKDVGRNSELSFSISTNQIDFVIDPKNGYIKSIRSFNREELIQTTGHDYLSMEVVVSDNGIVRRRDEANVFVTILDVNDNAPVFLRQPYKTSVSEGGPINTQVLRVSCSDLDEGLNGHVSYSLIGANSTFKIDKSNGQVVLVASLDRETQSKYTFTIVAHDSGLPSLTSTAQIVVDVLDENDNAPRFENAPESSSLPEDTPVGSEVLQFVASDEDIGVNSKMSFFLASGNLQETFRIDATSGVLYLEKLLDYETIPVYHLSVVATDGGSPRLSSSALVSIIVSDVNDNAPNLSKMPATRKIREGVPLKTLVLNVTAEDADSGVNGQIRYTIANQDPDGGHFAIDEHTGVVYTMRDIDREFTPTFRLRIVATDQALPVNKRLSAEKTLTIFVEDINDNAPVFVSLDSALVPEDAEKGFVVMTLSATDADAYENGQVSYELLPNFLSDGNDVFAVDRASGNLYLNRRLEKQTLYNVSVRAVDGAMPSKRKTSERTLAVLNLPVDDFKRRLQFERSEYRANVAENETAATPILTLAIKQLPDAAAPNKVRYFVTGVTSNGVDQKRLFNVGLTTGVLSTAAVLDRDQGVHEYTVEVLAVDEANDGQTMTARTK